MRIHCFVSRYPARRAPPVNCGGGRANSPVRYIPAMRAVNSSGSLTGIRPRSFPVVSGLTSGIGYTGCISCKITGQYVSVFTGGSFASVKATRHTRIARCRPAGLLSMAFRGRESVPRSGRNDDKPHKPFQFDIRAAVFLFDVPFFHSGNKSFYENGG